ncbi:MAG: hypothetical protein POG74_02720 [Acidocella sp.]|nr:hypothetical protein [Acidocella sp.]
MFNNLIFSTAAMAFQGTLLAIESQQVISMRLTKFALGGADVQEEAELMVAEKLHSLMEAGHMMMSAVLRGKSDLGADKVMQHYRTKVSANVARLST